MHEEVKRSKHSHEVDSMSGIIHKSRVYSLTDPSSLDRITVLFGNYFNQGFFCFQVINTSNGVKQSSVVIVRILGYLIKLKVKKVGLVSNSNEKLATTVKLKPNMSNMCWYSCFPVIINASSPGDQMLDLSNTSCFQLLFHPETDPPTTFYAGNQHVLVPYTWQPPVEPDEGI